VSLLQLLLLLLLLTPRSVDIMRRRMR